MMLFEHRFCKFFNLNFRLMLQLMCWQDWLFSLAYFEPEDQGSSFIIIVYVYFLKHLIYLLTPLGPPLSFNSFYYIDEPLIILNLV